MTRRGLYKMHTIAERTGFSPTLLRAWERRHALLDPERTDGGHRLYTEDDLEVLRQVRALLDSGLAIGEIASLGRPDLLARAGDRRGRAAPIAAEAALSSEQRARLGSYSAALVEAAVEVSDGKAEDALDQVFGLLAPQTALERVIAPALIEVGELWARGACSVAGEHLVSAKVKGRLLRLLEAANPSRRNGASPAICACLPDEQHELGALMAAYILARHHLRVVYLGACLPLEDLERACKVIQPAAVCLSVSRESLLSLHVPSLIELARRLPAGARLILGGRGVTADDRALREAGFTLLVPGGPDLEEVIETPVRAPRRRRKG
ncbi:MAG: MerR family transcriptional regulator [Planctomycetota bacterium]